jgi:hypothetical protein
MAKLHGIKDMSVEPIKGKSTEDVTPVSTESKLRVKKPKLYNRTGSGRFSDHIIMQNPDGRFVKVLRDDAIKKIEAGWKPIAKHIYKEALAKGAEPMVNDVIVKSKKK